MNKTNQENLCIDLLYEITLRIECMNNQEYIEKQIKINMNEEIKKELLKYILYILILNYIIILFIFFY
jgi:hypothetical protein